MSLGSRSVRGKAGGLAECALPAASVVGVLDPEPDCVVALVVGAPAAAVEHVLLHQGPEGLHRGVVPGGGDSAHRALQPGDGQDRAEGPGTELGGFNRSECTTTTPPGRRRAIAVRKAVAASCAVIRSSIAADDAVAEQVLDRAAVDLPLGGRVLGDVGDPHLIGALGGGVPLHVVVVHRRARALARTSPALAHRGRPQLLLRAQSPDPPLAREVASKLDFVGEEPVAELRVVAVGVDQGVGEVGVLEIAPTHRRGEPGVVGLGRVAQHPAGQPHGDALGGQITDQRVAILGGCRRRRCSATHRCGRPRTPTAT